MTSGPIRGVGSVERCARTTSSAKILRPSVRCRTQEVRSHPVAPKRASLTSERALRLTDEKGSTVAQASRPAARAPRPRRGHCAASRRPMQLGRIHPMPPRLVRRRFAAGSSGTATLFPGGHGKRLRARANRGITCPHPAPRSARPPIFRPRCARACFRGPPGRLPVDRPISPPASPLLCNGRRSCLPMGQYHLTRMWTFLSWEGRVSPSA